MKKPARLTVLLLSLPLLAGCFTVAQVPVPRTQPEREAADVRGAVIAGRDGEERLQYDEVLDVQWTPTSLSIVGATSGENGQVETETRLIPITELRGLLVRQLDAGPTSAIVGGVIVGVTAFLAVLINGSYDPETGS